MFPIITLMFGYALFYWGLHHFPGYHRYSLFTLLGIDTIISSPMPNISKGIQFQAGGGIQP